MRILKSVLQTGFILIIMFGLTNCNNHNSSMIILHHQIDSLDSKIKIENDQLKEKSSNNPYQYAPFWQLAEWINHENKIFNANLDSIINLSIIDSFDYQKISNDVKEFKVIYQNHTPENDLSENLSLTKLDKALELISTTKLEKGKQLENLLTLKYEVMKFHLDYIEYLNTKEIIADREE